MTFRLRSLGLFPRVGMFFIMLVFLGGFAASNYYIYSHHSKKDDEPGLSFNDIKGQYHGVLIRSPLVASLENNHPPELPADKRKALLDWLLGKPNSAGERPKDGNPRLAQDYDNDDLGDFVPSVLIAQNCLSCHKRDAADPVAKKLPLEYWDDVKKIAFSKELSPVSVDILAISTHTHALSLAALTGVVVLLAYMTSWSRRLLNVLVGVAGVGLFLDIASWWVAREYAGAVYTIIIGGGMYNGGTVLMIVLIMLDVLLPAKKAA